MIHAQPPVTEDTAFTGKTDDQLFFRPPFLVYFDRPAIDEINAFDDLTFFKDQVSFFEVERLPVCFHGGYPLGQTTLAKKTGSQIAVMGLLLHVCKIALYVDMTNMAFRRIK
jgi:hypothetical protein